jgi:excisionase family DNA binding protein
VAGFGRRLGLKRSGDSARLRGVAGDGAAVCWRWSSCLVQWLELGVPAARRLGAGGPVPAHGRPHAHVRPLLTPRRRTLARHGFRVGGPFRDLRASLEQRPMTDEAQRSPDDPFGGHSRRGVTSELPLPPEADRPPAPRTFLSADECARRAMLSRKAIYRAIESGELLAFRVRARLRVPEEEFSRWMTADPISSTPTGRSQSISTRRPAPASSFRSVLRTVERGQA